MNLDKPKIISILEKVENAKRENRNTAANIVYKDEKLFEELIHYVFKTDDKLSVRAAWILEWICTHHDINLIIPYLNIFCDNIHNLQFDGSVRSCAKICEHLATGYAGKKENLIQQELKEIHRNRIIEVGFDWLITPQKIAVRAYIMNTLYLLGKEKDWVHPELEHLIRSKIIHESKGCKARGRKVLELIEKHKKRDV